MHGCYLVEVLCVGNKMMELLADLNTKAMNAVTGAIILGEYEKAADMKNLLTTTITKLEKIIESTPGLELKVVPVQESNNK